MDMICSMICGGALTTKALVGLSAQIETLLLAALAAAVVATPPGAAVPVTDCVMP
jgi:hypothetical protein